LVKTCFYINDELERTYYYTYHNRILIQKLVYYRSDKPEYRAVYYYKNRLLIRVLEYYFDSDISESQIIFEYNIKYQLVKKIVTVPPISSYIDHEIHYAYY
jgi:hypothetical protein